MITKRYAIAVLPASVLAALAIEIPTDLLPNPLFTRMTPIRPVDWVLWPIMSLAIGAVLATYALPRPTCGPNGLSAGAGGGVLGVLLSDARSATSSS